MSARTGDPQKNLSSKKKMAVSTNVGVRSAMRADSQLPGMGPTDVDDAPAPAR